jgi:flagellar FliL protein
MENRNTILVILLILVIILAVVGIALGFMYRRNKGVESTSIKQLETFNLTLDDMYCNIKESKKIVKVKVTVETTNEKTFKMLGEKQFLIRDDINKIIRNKTEEELQGEEGQVQLQNEIKENLVALFKDETITNVYFNDLIIQ